MRMMKTPRRSFLSALAGLIFSSKAQGQSRLQDIAVIDDLSREPPTATIGTKWQLFTDKVMGGVSKATMVRETVSGRSAIRLRGDVSLANNGGFVQIALDLHSNGEAIDAGSWNGIEIDVFGNDEEYALNLRTTDLTRPWQSYRQIFSAPKKWITVRLPFDKFLNSRTDIPINLHRLRRIGVIAIGRAFSPDISIAGIRFYREQ